MDLPRSIHLFLIQYRNLLHVFCGITDPEEVCRRLVVLHGLLQVSRVILVDLRDGLVVLGGDGEAAHLGVNLDGLVQAVGGLWKGIRE